MPPPSTGGGAAGRSVVTRVTPATTAAMLMLLMVDMLGSSHATSSSADVSAKTAPRAAPPRRRRRRVSVTVLHSDNWLLSGRRHVCRTILPCSVGGRKWRDCCEHVGIKFAAQTPLSHHSHVVLLLPRPSVFLYEVYFRHLLPSSTASLILGQK